MTHSPQVRLARRPVGEPTDDTYDFGEVELPGARGRPAAAAGGLPLARPLHARPDERRPVVRRTRSRSVSVMVGGTVCGRRGVAHTPTGGRATSRCPTPAGRPTRSATAAGCAGSTRPVAPVSTALGVLGMPGFTAYAGLLEIGRPQPGETVVVAAATGPVGSAVGQIARLKGARAVGIAGGRGEAPGAARGVRLRRRAVDHRSPDFAEELAAAVPDGIDVYFENVGGAGGRARSAGTSTPTPGSRSAAWSPTTTPRRRPRARTGCPASWAWCCARA